MRCIHCENIIRLGDRFITLREGVYGEVPTKWNGYAAHAACAEALWLYTLGERAAEEREKDGA